MQMTVCFQGVALRVLKIQATAACERSGSTLPVSDSYVSSEYQSSNGQKNKTRAAHYVQNRLHPHPIFFPPFILQ